MKALLSTTLLLICNILLGQVTITGTVKHAKDSIIVFKETDGFTNITRAWQDKRYKARIDRNNHFVVTLPEQDINRWLIETENGYQFFDLAKGNNIGLIADFSKEMPLTAIGKNADDFNYLTYASGKNKPGKAYQKGIRSKHIDSVLFWRKQMAARNIQSLDQYRRTHNMSDVYYHWIKSKYTYEPYERACVENMDKKDSMSSAVLSKLPEPGINNDYAALNTREYNDLVEIYIDKKFIDAGIEYTPGAYFTLATTLLQGKTRDVFLTRFTARFVQTADSLYNPVYEKYNALVKDSTLKNHLVKGRNDYLDLLNQKEENTSQYALLNEIFSKYKGKVMYVDFWASWCMPCRSEMPNAAELKKQLSGKEVVFVYLGYRDTEKAWLKAREDLDIQGEHYLLNNKLIEEAEEAFNISGIPHYVIIDKAGNIVNKRAGRPGQVYQQLSDLINKE